MQWERERFVWREKRRHGKSPKPIQIFDSLCLRVNVSEAGIGCATDFYCGFLAAAVVLKRCQLPFPFTHTTAAGGRGIKSVVNTSKFGLFGSESEVKGKSRRRGLMAAALLQLATYCNCRVFSG